MSDNTLSDNTLDAVDKYKRSLTLRFILTGVIGVLLVTFLITASGYYFLRVHGQEIMIERNSDRISDYLADYRSFGAKLDQNSQLNATKLYAQSFAELSQKITSIARLSSVSFYKADRTLRWRSGQHTGLNKEELSQFNKVLAGKPSSMQFNGNIFKLSTWMSLYSNTNEPHLSVLIPWTDLNDRKPGVIKITINPDVALSTTRELGRALFVISLFGNLLVFLFLYLSFRRGIKTIGRQGYELNQQISRLSNLLTITKSMQRNMKTASSRAVELNEQFLRRVGSDLHDGPAQSIGYAVLRLDKLSQQEEVKKLGHEFHVVKEALDDSIEEIRRISSGLVMPELEGMTLEESIRKVVIRHQSNAKVEVAQYYQDIPDDIPLPIRICAYRFIQEGLNNAHRHGQAKKCRITAKLKDGVLHLSLKDNGMGFRKSSLSIGDGAHLGLMGLRDRVESLGGEFSINSELGVGTALKISVAVSE